MRQPLFKLWYLLPDKVENAWCTQWCSSSNISSFRLWCQKEIVRSCTIALPSYAGCILIELQITLIQIRHIWMREETAYFQGSSALSFSSAYTCLVLWHISVLRSASLYTRVSTNLLGRSGSGGLPSWSWWFPPPDLLMGRWCPWMAWQHSSWQLLSWPRKYNIS